jgi:hypothetical protein
MPRHDFRSRGEHGRGLGSEALVSTVLHDRNAPWSLQGFFAPLMIF